MGYASYNTKFRRLPLPATAAEVTVDIETGQIVVDRLVMAADAGVVVNPLTASGQIEGGILQSLGYALCEEMAMTKPVSREKQIHRLSPHAFG